jgi:hypothetical protein
MATRPTGSGDPSHSLPGSSGSSDHPANLPGEGQPPIPGGVVWTVPDEPPTQKPPGYNLLVFILLEDALSAPGSSGVAHEYFSLACELADMIVERNNNTIPGDLLSHLQSR